MGPGWGLGAYVAVAIATAAGCGSGDERTTEASSAELFCNADCSLARRCQGIDPSPCLDVCQVALSESLAVYRPEAVSSVGRCVERLDCSASAAPDAYAPCWEQAEREVAPAPATLAFCVDQVSAWYECGGLYSIEECKHDYNLMTGEFLDRLRACHSLPCGQLASCEVAIWESL